MKSFFKPMWMAVLVAAMAGCSHYYRPCSFCLEFIGDVPSDFGDYAVVEVNTCNLVQCQPWGYELYSDALTNKSSFALITRESRSEYQYFLSQLGCGSSGIDENVVLGTGVSDPECLDVDFLLQRDPNLKNIRDLPRDALITASKTLAEWIRASSLTARSDSIRPRSPLVDNLRFMALRGGLVADVDYGELAANKEKVRLPLLAYGCIVAEKYPGIKHLFVDESSVVKDKVMQHGRAPLPCEVRVVDKRSFVFCDADHIAFARLDVDYSYGYFRQAFKEANQGSKTIVEMAFREILNKGKVGTKIFGRILCDKRTGDMVMKTWTVE